ncbi:hypothetical protein F4778DRAFT_793670 [Xylariomycetidae sp. FL2044]|nr:hypothetical protein F4778DRAFT_793670 [Xylariomycetidae sp. FL2044]
MILPFHIPFPLQKGSTHSLTAPRLMSRAGGNDASQTTVFIIIGVVGGIVAFLIAFYVIRRRKFSGKSRRGRTQNGGFESLGAPANAVSETNRNSNRHSTASQVDRNTSVRSIMTLPEYRRRPSENEQVLGREGERDGVDVVVEHPTAEEHEALRDEEMEALYQVRLARRQQNADRAERHRLQAEARARGDILAMEELRSRRRRQLEDTTVSDLREGVEQIKDRRARAVSSVSYHDVGLARHDGSRIRANSTESERVGLLSDAASIALSVRSPSAQSHRRDRSDSSALSLDDFPSPGLRSGATTPRLGRAGSSPDIIDETDLGDTLMPPPDYDEVSLSDVRSGATTPTNFNEPPPDYDHERRSSQATTTSLSETSPVDSHDGRTSAASKRSSRGVDGPPQLPSLRIAGLPQIVIEPSTAHPGDDHRRSLRG